MSLPSLQCAMPPFLPRKRAAADPLPSESSHSRPSKKSKVTDALDAPAGAPSSALSNRRFSLGEDSESSLSDLDSEGFEDVPKQGNAEDKDDVDWEDALEETTAPQPTSDLQLTLAKDATTFDYGSMASYGTTKKGPSKIERQIRIATHRMHVQCLLFHNAIRNTWVSDAQTHQILLKQLSPGIVQDVQRWKVASGLIASEPAKPINKKGRKRRSERDWGTPSKRLEEGQPDLSRGDPLIPLLKTLVADWRKRFKISAPGLRKHGYKPKRVLQAEIASFHNDSQDPERHGERIRNVGEFRARARQMTGSRDVGAQLFTALLRAIGIESRLVANLQPIGFGWTKAEEAIPSKPIQEDGQSLNAAPDDNDDAEEQLEDNQTDDESVVEVVTAPKGHRKKYDIDLAFPIYWTETISPVSNAVTAVSPFLANPISTTQETCVSFQPTGTKADKAKQVMGYVVGFSGDGTAKDVTTRYLKGRRWPGKTKGVRFPVEKIPIYNKRGKILRHEEYDWFKHTMRPYVRQDFKRTVADDLEDSADLVPRQPERKDTKEEGDTLQSLRSSADFVLERFLRREEALRPGSEHVRMFTHGKGEKAKEEKVFLRNDVVPVKTAESWHKEGRRIQPGETPLKLAPIRAVTLTRKREVEEEMRETGEKPMQGLYSVEQTEYIIPPPIQDGIIPKNAYGNIDCFVPSMVPEGAVHLPYRGTVKMCKKLEIDFAEAVVGFEFGNKRAVPVIQGVVVAQESQQAVLDALQAYEAEQKKKEESKQEKTILGLWRKMLMGLRIAERMQDEYGADNMEPKDVIDLRSASNIVAGRQLRDAIPVLTEDLRSSDLNGTGANVGAGGFLLHDEDKPQPEELVLDAGHGGDPAKVAAEEYPTPLSAPPPQAVKSSRSLLAESEEAELSDLEYGSDSNTDTEAKGRRTSSSLKSSKSKPTKRGADKKEDIASTTLKPPHQRASKATRSQDSPSKHNTSVKSTPRRQQVRKAKEVLTSPYFDPSDTDD